jgi:hypothetical protein
MLTAYFVINSASGPVGDDGVQNVSKTDNVSSSVSSQGSTVDIRHFIEVSITMVLVPLITDGMLEQLYDSIFWVRLRIINADIVT